MNITIKKPNDIDGNAIRANFPREEESLSRICNELRIKQTTGKNCFIVDAMSYVKELMKSGQLIGQQGPAMGGI